MFFSRAWDATHSQQRLAGLPPAPPGGLDSAEAYARRDARCEPPTPCTLRPAPCLPRLPPDLI